MPFKGTLTALISICLVVVATCECNIETNTLTSNCEGQCDGYDACTVYDATRHYYYNACGSGDSSSKHQNKSKSSGVCQFPDNSGCVYQCFHLFDSNNSTFELTVPNRGYNDSMEPDTPWTLNGYIDNVDIQIPDHIDTLKFVGVEQGKGGVHFNITDETFTSRKNLKNIYFDNVILHTVFFDEQSNMPD